MDSKTKIVTKEQIQPLLEHWRKEAGIVFTNGCFDIVHLGHVDYLEKARNLGNKLVLGLNTDQSIRKLKGPDRPINNEYARARVLAAMQFVDAVILFDEDTPYELIKYINPDILVKGNDYSIQNIVGADIVLAKGGKVETIELVNGYSTSSVISKIKTN